MFAVVPISIDPFYPGDQGEGVHAARFWNYEKDGFVYEGVNLELLVDMRDVEEGLYSMEFVDGTNTAVLTVPTLAATWRKDKSEHEARVAADDCLKGSQCTQKRLQQAEQRGSITKAAAYFSK